MESPDDAKLRSPTDEPIQHATSHDDPEMDGKTLYEKKCVLINREMDANGMGKYQWWIWSLCGFGFLLDLMWAQAFGLVLQPLKQELGFPRKLQSRTVYVEL